MGEEPCPGSHTFLVAEQEIKYDILSHPGEIKISPVEVPLLWIMLVSSFIHSFLVLTLGYVY